jgi:hypothetical protein
MAKARPELLKARRALKQREHRCDVALYNAAVAAVPDDDMRRLPVSAVVTQKQVSALAKKVRDTWERHRLRVDRPRIGTAEVWLTPPDLREGHAEGDWQVGVYTNRQPAPYRINVVTAVPSISLDIGFDTQPVHCPCISDDEVAIDAMLAYGNKADREKAERIAVQCPRGGGLDGPKKLKRRRK